jgi:hypothetical protein
MALTRHVAISYAAAPYFLTLHGVAQQWAWQLPEHFTCCATPLILLLL